MDAQCKDDTRCDVCFDMYNRVMSPIQRDSHCIFRSLHNISSRVCVEVEVEVEVVLWGNGRVCVCVCMCARACVGAP